MLQWRRVPWTFRGGWFIRRDARWHVHFGMTATQE
jgi:hypothetical protein